MSIQEERFKGIADAIRAKLGTTDLIRPLDFAEKVAEVYDKGVFDRTVKHLTGSLGNYIIPSGITQLRTTCFYGRSDLKSLIIPSSVNYVANGMCQQCENITSVIFEGGRLNTWGANNFSGCKSLKSVHFGCTISSLQTGNFNSCVALEEVTFAQPELSGSFFIHNTAVLKKKCAYDMMRKLKNQTGTDKDYTIKFHADVWTAIENATAEDYETPPSGANWKEYVTDLGYNI
jgi:hypothetical protein